MFRTKLTEPTQLFKGAGITVTRFSPDYKEFCCVVVTGEVQTGQELHLKFTDFAILANQGGSVKLEFQAKEGGRKGMDLLSRETALIEEGSSLFVRAGSGCRFYICVENNLNNVEVSQVNL